MQYRIIFRKGVGMAADEIWICPSIQRVAELIAVLYLLPGDEITIKVERA